MSVELVQDVSTLEFGDVVLDDADAWCVATYTDMDGPDGVRLGPGPRLEVTVSLEALRRALLGEFPAVTLRAWSPVARAWVSLYGPLRRVVEPKAFLRMQPSSPLVAALLAFHASKDLGPHVHSRAEAALVGAMRPER